MVHTELFQLTKQIGFSSVTFPACISILWCIHQENVYLCMSLSVCGTSASAHWGSNGGNRITAQPCLSPDKHVYISTREVSSERHTQDHCLSCYFYVCPGLQRLHLQLAKCQALFWVRGKWLQQEDVIWLPVFWISYHSSCHFLTYSLSTSAFPFSWPVPLNHPVCFSLPTSGDPH